ncbi:hypothetical protein [Peijinzhouia sedimentorum]
MEIPKIILNNKNDRMKEEQLAKMNVVELKKKIKSHRFINGLLTVIVVVMFLVAFVIKPETSIASKILPFAFIPMLITFILDHKKLRKELKSRQKE